MYVFAGVVVFVLLLWGVTAFLKSKGFSMESKMTEGDEEGDSVVKDYLNDAKLTERWQNAKDVKLAVEGKKTVKDGEDRFHLTGKDDPSKY